MVQKSLSGDRLGLCFEVRRVHHHHRYLVPPTQGDDLVPQANLRSTVGWKWDIGGEEQDLQS
jgi:hypothetical protein